MDKKYIEDKFSELPIFEIFTDIINGNRFNYAFAHATWTSLREKMDKIELSDREYTYLHLYNLLYTLEGPFSFVMNAVIYSLISDGHHDIWSRSKGDYVSSFDEIFDISLPRRLKFLNRHDFKFFSDICPRSIRNAIAHQSFEIDLDGVIHMNEKEYSLSYIISQNEKMYEIVKIFMERF